MKAINGRAIFLALFTCDEAPFDHIQTLGCRLAELGCRGVQIPVSDPRFIDLETAAETRDYCDALKGELQAIGLEFTKLASHLQGQLIAVPRAFNELFDGIAPEQVRGNPVCQRLRRRRDEPTSAGVPRLSCLAKAGLSVCIAAFAAVFSPALSADWSYYGGDAGGTRYSRLAEITPANVTSLEQAWVYRTGDEAAGYPSREQRSFEATPILVGETLYLSTPFGEIHAVDAATGERRWRFQSRPPQDRNYSENTSRGVSYWLDALAPPTDDAPCLGRIFFGTQDARLLALDATSGLPCLDFGDAGAVDLNKGARPKWPGNYLITSPPVIYRDLVITGSAVGDNGAVDLELGVVRAVDARTGEVIWAFDPVPRDRPDDPAFNDWRADQLAKTGAANAWSVLSLDEELGLVFIPTGSASPDFYGGERLGDNRHANSIVALNAATGELVWARQLVHHDLWDYDVPAQPTLVSLERAGETLPALVQITKMGMMFVLDRRTGEPIFGIEERVVPASDVPGEVAAPTQPFSSLPSLVSHAPLTSADAFGLALLDRMQCASQIKRYRSEGIYTPPSLQGTILRPAYTGGGNWGGVAWDPSRNFVITNVSHLAAVVQLLPREEFERQSWWPDFSGSQYTAQSGTPFGMRREILTSFLGIPCVKPPWGTLAAMDLGSGKIAWQVPLGTSEDLAPWPFKDIQGMPAIGGPIVTAGGLIFISAALDDYLRAFDVTTGKELWRGRLPAGGQATPMTYASGGRQFVVIAAGGHGGAGTTLGDYLVAFTLPR